MNNDDILATFKKHLSGIEEIDSSFTKTHIHNFGETMKGINEFIGAVQIINLNLHKIKNLVEKIQWIDDLLNTESNAQTIQSMQTERQNYLSNIQHLVDNEKFMGIALFDVELSCLINGRQFNLDVASPINFINDDLYGYCSIKINELNMLQSQISKCLSGEDDTANVSDFDNIKDAIESLGREACGFKPNAPVEKASDAFLANESFEDIEKNGIVAISFKCL